MLFFSGQIYDVPASRLMSVRSDSPGNAIPGREFEPLHTMHLQGHGSCGFESASTLVRDMYGDIVDDSALVVGGSSVSA